ncbi:hypothetical protein HEP73_00921 [Xanthomonas sp. GW]|uniref:hypothetical protein n=1 Tax=Xanthomonas sp. GW TaxID=2724121 RepID=UPI001639D6A5|nr:hypothetical protein [Xanthomonas sp. GW]QNH20023.1 hypothetical protein HEP73_00921 [Xanthomonas sp. GW]
MKSQYIVSALLLLTAAPAFAATCEANFEKKGNPFIGTSYSTSVSLPNLTVKSAIGQMHVIAKQANMDILSEDADAGAMLIEEPETLSHKPIPMIISASVENGEGKVGMLVKLNKGALASSDSVRNEMCKLLNQVKPGTEGEKFAKKTVDAAPVEISADKFGFMLRNQAKEGPATIEARYKDKVYRITGKINSSGVLKSGGKYNVGFDVFTPEDETYNKVAIICSFAANQAAYALALRPGEKATLTGVVEDYDQLGKALWLRDCRGN